MHRCHLLNSGSHPEAHLWEWHPVSLLFRSRKGFWLSRVSHSPLSHLQVSYIDVNGKCWRLIKDWYSDTSSVVKVNNKCSDSFPVNRDVKQGSSLSPNLFIAVMDFLLSFLKSSGQGLTLFGLNVGNSAHADDVRAASISVIARKHKEISSVHLQGKLIEANCRQNWDSHGDQRELQQM